MSARKRLETTIARRRGRRLFSFTAKVARWYIRSYDNLDYELDTNGERWLVEHVVQPGSFVIDVGANAGEWTSLVKHQSSTAIVHAFEIVPSTAAGLFERVERDVVVNDIGLLDKEGTVDVRHLPTFTAGSSIFETIHRDVVEMVRCRVTTGDIYCVEHGIDQVDLLKIDAEGADHLVLAGFKGMIERGAIDVIQFEYGMSSIVSRFLLVDFYRLLGDAGFVIGKLFPSWVEFGDYDLRQEDFRGPNFVAVRTDRKDIIERLQPPRSVMGRFGGSSRQ